MTEKAINDGKDQKAVKKIFTAAAQLVEYRGKRDEWLFEVEERYKELIEVLYT